MKWNNKYTRTFYSFHLYFICFISVFFLNLEVNAQRNRSGVTQKSKNLYEDGIRFLNQRQNGLAKEQLREAIKLSPHYQEAHITLGDILRKENHLDSAIFHYSEALKTDSNNTAHPYFGLGESYLFKGDYLNAKNHLETFISRTPTPSPSIKNSTQSLYSLAQKYLKDCHFSLHELNQSETFQVQEITSFNNSEYDEYFPHITADFNKIIFTRKEGEHENFYESRLTKDYEFHPSTLLKGKINSQNFNEGAHCISPDGKYLFFTGCNRPEGLGSCDIYVSKLENGEWSEPYNLGAPINTKGWESQPSISADGNTLYFVSNRQGGQGGYDIWKSTLMSNGKWSEPQNLGPQINTPHDESAPFIHADNETLFFTSNGWPGFGRKDFFKSKLIDNNKWSTPKNLGYPLNNHLDQSSITFSMNGKIAIFSSPSQADNTNLDIFLWEVPEEIRPARVTFINGSVKDEKNLQPLSAEVNVYNLDTQKEIFTQYSDTEDGRFIAPLPFGNSYSFHIHKPGYLLYSQHFSLKSIEKEGDEVNLEFFLKPISIGSNVTLHNVFFDIDKAQLKEESFKELDLLYEFLMINPQTVIEISGHTDNTGSDAHNDSLSIERAKTVRDYLLTKGIASQRIQFKGYGSTQPIASNSTEEGRQQNRRTDFKIIQN